uniref:Secreted protein n=1 Tax=Caenorhabditis japonica TaxID=281687 RepID=A0A8R1E9D6_CAEJA
MLYSHSFSLPICALTCLTVCVSHGQAIFSPFSKSSLNNTRLNTTLGYTQAQRDHNHRDHFCFHAFPFCYVSDLLHFYFVDFYFHAIFKK